MGPDWDGLRCKAIEFDLLFTDFRLIPQAFYYQTKFRTRGQASNYLIMMEHPLAVVKPFLSLMLFAARAPGRCVARAAEHTDRPRLPQ